MSDFDFEPVKGLPAALPENERMLWQGAPRWQDLAVHAFHARKAAYYLLGLGAAHAAFRVYDGEPMAESAIVFLWYVVLAGAAAALLSGLAYASARTTVYTITSKRLVLRIGIALPVTINLPFKLVDSASVKLYGNGSGDIPLKLAKGNRIAYFVLWPHARRWHLTRPEPALRAVPDADRVATLLASALTSTPLPAMLATATPAESQDYGGNLVAA